MSVLNLMTSAWEAVADWRRRKRAFTGLMALDDHALADIGIRRSDIRDLCEGAYVRAPSTAPARSSASGEFASPKAV